MSTVTYPLSSSSIGIRLKSTTTPILNTFDSRGLVKQITHMTLLNNITSIHLIRKFFLYISTIFCLVEENRNPLLVMKTIVSTFGWFNNCLAFKLNLDASSTWATGLREVLTECFKTCIKFSYGKAEMSLREHFIEDCIISDMKKTMDIIYSKCFPINITCMLNKVSK